MVRFPSLVHTWLSAALRAGAALALLLAGVAPAGAWAGPAAPAVTNVVGLGGSPCAYPTLAAALAAAPVGGTLYLAPGTYSEVLGTLNQSVSFTAASANCTTAVTNGNPFDYVIDGGGFVGVNGGLVNLAAGRVVTFTNVTLQNAQATQGGLVFVSAGAALGLVRTRLRDGQANVNGGLLFVAPGALAAVGDTNFETGQAGTAGGALYVAGQAQLYGVTVRDSSATLGGGVAVAGEGRVSLSVTHLGDGLHPNSAAVGGGLFVSDDAQVDLNSSSTVRWNDATGSGGGVYATGAVTIALQGTAQIYGNASGADGGGLYAEDGAVLSFADDSQLGDDNPAWGNTATGNGGGLYADGASLILIEDSAVVWHNTAVDGGGLYLTGGTPLTMTGGALRSNQAAGLGGGLAVAHGAAYLRDTVIAENAAQQGGGVGFANHAGNQLLAINTQIISNTAEAEGGGVYSDQANFGLVALDGTGRLSGNTAGGNGGGLYLTGSANLALGSSTLGSPVEVAGNTTSGSGGGLYFDGPGHLILVGALTLAGNYALADGGGVYQSGGELIVMGLTPGLKPQITGNTAANGSGGGLYLVDVNSVPGNDGAQAGNLLVSGNQADVDGGGLYVGGGTYLRLFNALIHANLAGQAGGGLAVDGATVEMGAYAEGCQNVTLAPNHYCSELRNNAATIEGGAVSLAGTLVVSHTAVISNSAGLGGGVYSGSNGDHLELVDTLFTANTGKALYVAADGELELIQSTFAGNDWAIDINDNGATAELQNNLIWGNGFGVETAVVPTVGCSFSQNGVGGTIKDPLFQTTGRGAYRLAANSPAVDACLIGTAVDLDGLARPQGVMADMGAFEGGVPLVLFAGSQDVAEGDAGLTPAAFTVSLSQTSTQTITLSVAAVAGSAAFPSDYAAPAASLVFAPGVLTQTLALASVGDLTYEADETYTVTLSGGAGAALLADSAAITILNDDDLPSLLLTPAAVPEGNSGLTPVTLTVSLSHPSAFTVTVDYDTGGGSAASGEDYVEASGTLIFAPGTTSQAVPVAVIGDTLLEPDEHASLYLSHAVGAALPLVAGGPALPGLDILNDDAAVYVLYLPLVVR